MASNAQGTRVAYVSIGRILSRAFSVIGGNPVAIFGVAFLFGALPQVAWSYVAAQPAALASAQIGARSIVSVIALPLAGVAINMLLAQFVQAGTIRATMAHVAGERASLGECIAAGFAVALPLLGLGILAGIGIMVGFIFAVVPGVILYIIWSVAAPALVAERLGVFEAFGRSRQLTKGARWKIFGLDLLIGIFYWIVSALAGLILFAIYGLSGVASLARSGGSLSIGWILFSLLASTLTASMWAAIHTSLFVELREWKEGPQTERLADIFA